MGAFGLPGIFAEAKKNQDEAIIASRPHIMKAWREMEKVVGRKYEPVETYKLEGAETAFLTMGSFSETASIAIDRLREQGKPVGQIKLRLWRPFPFDEIRAATKGIKNLIVIDRAISYGGPGGPVASEIRAALYQEKNMPRVANFLCGFAGRDVTADDFLAMYARTEELVRARKPVREEDYVFYGVRE
jgi:pyruvate ferredoxin oxidoreductase alpha subunit